MTPVEVTQGTGPVVLGLPHTGTWLPDEVLAQLKARGRELDDTDWHIHTLYEGLLPGATTVRAAFHRYLIDANRDPSGQSLYPGQNTTGLVPMTDFDGHPIWESEPTPDEVEARRATYHAAYHAALSAELERVHAAHGVAILYDCHSIRSQIPFLFDGTIRDITEPMAAEEKFAGLLGIAPSPTLIVDSQGLIVSANAQTENLLGYEPDELIGKPIEMLVPERYRPGHEDHRAGRGAGCCGLRQHDATEFDCDKAGAENI